MYLIFCRWIKVVKFLRICSNAISHVVFKSKNKHRMASELLVLLVVPLKLHTHIILILLYGGECFTRDLNHFIRDPSGVFSVCHLCECRIVQ